MTGAGEPANAALPGGSDRGRTAAAPAAALRVLLAGLVDYAGLFPPAKLGMAAAARNFATYRAGEHAWALGRFVVPAARLDEFAAAARAAGGPADVWRVSALVGGDFNADFAAIARFNAAHGDSLAVVDAVEAVAANPTDVARAVHALEFDATPYFELAASSEDLADCVAAVAELGARAKIRTGGVTPEAIPPSSHVARFVAACARAGVPFKATAGLHHPVRSERALTYEPDAPRAAMHGFLNVFVAAALCRAGSAGERDMVAVLDETAPEAFVVADGEVGWRALRASVEDLARTRSAFAISFGSCSFDEPIDDLKDLGLL